MPTSPPLTALCSGPSRCWAWVWCWQYFCRSVSDCCRCAELQEHSRAFAMAARASEGRFPAESRRSPANSTPSSNTAARWWAAPAPMFPIRPFPQDAAQRAGERGGPTVSAGRPGAAPGRLHAPPGRPFSPARARPARRRAGQPHRCRPVLYDLARVLKRIHAERAIAIDADARPTVFPRRAPGPGGDGGQSHRQCLQMGRPPGDGARP